ncbi:hypothetical protein O181_007502 [Austropuccinia psidii MF-1]|uniref:Uncharacterized protein n=1 Tax=Austropuccinia psidii MF-1 TaxID=1389203 RepID=A0A9Q3GIJ4_9BASI|nr:hypothetical protein [Austropuccinia psidii MF-1]
MVNISKPLEGGHELLLTHQEHSSSGEYHETPRSLKPSSVYQNKEVEITPDLEKEGPVESTCSITLQRQAERSQKKQRQGEGKVDWHRPYPQGYRIPKL